MDVEAYPLGCTIRHGLHPSLVSLARREHEGSHERHLDPAGGVRTPYSSRPEPRDHRLAVRTFRIEVPDALLRLVAHPLAVVPDVLGEARRPSPPVRAGHRTAGTRVHGRLPGEPRRDFDQGLGDEDGN